MGIDVGFSRSRPTTGIAWSSNGTFGATKTHTDWERRRQHLPATTTFSMIAIDGPLVPAGSPDTLVRTCEQLLARGAFQKRCKPGSSHFGTGLQLKRAASDTAQQFRHLGSVPMFGKAVFPEVAIVEAFPNAFLGVMLEDAAFAGGQIARGKKFDRMYEVAVESGRLSALMSQLAWNAPDLLHAIETQYDHEKRAAFICLLTAACAAAGNAEVVGDPVSGWIWLPPKDLWAGWAIAAMHQNAMRLSLEPVHR
nr:DUF429 domain-containing protein [Ensifer sp. ENS04]